LNSAPVPEHARPPEHARLPVPNTAKTLAALATVCLLSFLAGLEPLVPSSPRVLAAAPLGTHPPALALGRSPPLGVGVYTNVTMPPRQSSTRIAALVAATRKPHARLSVLAAEHVAAAQQRRVRSAAGGQHVVVVPLRRVRCKVQVEEGQGRGRCSVRCCVRR